MIAIANSMLIFGFWVAGAAAATAFVAGRLRRDDLLESTTRFAYLLLGLTTLLLGILTVAFIQRDFSLAYVAAYSNRTLPLFYTISAVWAGQSGSLLFWTWLLGLFGALVAWQNREKNRDLLPYALGVIFLVILFFFGTMIFAESPFKTVPFPPADGLGLNPMLQNIGMVIHPPLLFLGYVGFTVPFAFAIAALLRNRADAQWLYATRRWTLMAWLFLTLGILFGAKWAYVELGWGGYWAWDPVENASLMPWLTATAYLHSVMIQEKRGMLKVWNMVLVITTFALTIFGTFLTRSGLLSSVHSFGGSTLGPLLLGFLMVIIVISFGLLLRRIPLLKSEHELDSILSRESSFLFNNLILVALAFAVFWGTMFPVISEAVRGIKITVGPPYFNKVNIPIGLALLALTGIGPLIAWRKTSSDFLRRNFALPLGVGLITAIGLFFLGVRSFYPNLSFALSAFVTVSIAHEFYRGSVARMHIAESSFVRALLDLTARNKRRYGGYIIHLGIVMIFVGITGSSTFQQETIAVLKPGEKLELKDYTLRYKQLVDRSTEHVQVVAAEFEISKNGSVLTTMYPSREYHGNHDPVSEVAIRQTMKEDLYLILVSWDEETAVSVKALVIPLVAWIWSGGLVMIAGTLMALGSNSSGRQSITGARSTSAVRRREVQYA